MTEGGERIAKVIARAGLCSRREAERLIAQGRVTLDGEVLESPAVTVGPAARIAVDGDTLPAAAPARLWRYHKAAGILTTASDPRGRTTLYDRLPHTLPRVMPVGRLDINSEGLLLLTNDGGLKRRLELPSTGWARRYRVRVYGRAEDKALAALAKGVTVEGVDYGPITARVDSRSGANTWLTMALSEGKNREIRRVCEHLGLQVNRLIRIAYGPFQLGKLATGTLEEVPAKALEEQLGAVPGKASGGGRKIGQGWAKAKPRKTKPGSSKPGQDKPGKVKPGTTKRDKAKPGENRRANRRGTP